MEIVIYGCGAIGSVIATLIGIFPGGKYHRIHIIGRKRIIDKIEKEGLIYVHYDNKFEVVTDGYILHETPENIKKADVVFFTVKAYDFEKALEEARNSFLTEDMDVIIAMNGLGLKEIAARYVSPDKITEVMVGYPSRLENGNKVINTGGNSVFTVCKSEYTADLFGKIFDPVSGRNITENPPEISVGPRSEINFQLPFRFVENFGEIKWRKAMANIGINGISAITMLTVGGVIERKTLKILVKELIKEAEMVAAAEGVNFKDDPAEWVLNFAAKDPHHKTSTLQDILRNKPTEIGFMNGYIVKKAEEMGIEVPINRAICNMMGVIEKELLRSGRISS